MAVDDSDGMLSKKSRRDLPESKIEVLYMTLDPSNDVKRPWVICSCYYEKDSNNQVIVQFETMDLARASDSDIASWIESVVDSLRNIHDSFKKSRIFFSSCSPNEYYNKCICDIIHNFTVITKSKLFDVPTNRRYGFCYEGSLIWPERHKTKIIDYSIENIVAHKVFFSSHFNSSVKSHQHNTELNLLLVLKSFEEKRVLRLTTFTRAFVTNAYFYLRIQKMCSRGHLRYVDFTNRRRL